jgi:hypothetical protein
MLCSAKVSLNSVRPSLKKLCRQPGLQRETYRSNRFQVSQLAAISCSAFFERDEAFYRLGLKITDGGIFFRGHIEDRPERDLLADEIQVVEILPGSARQQGVQFHQGNSFDGSEAGLLRSDQRRRQLISVAYELFAGEKSVFSGWLRVTQISEALCSTYGRSWRP